MGGEYGRGRVSVSGSAWVEEAELSKDEEEERGGEDGEGRAGGGEVDAGGDVGGEFGSGSVEATLTSAI